MHLMVARFSISTVATAKFESIKKVEVMQILWYLLKSGGFKLLSREHRTHPRFVWEREREIASSSFYYKHNSFCIGLFELS